MKVSLTKRKPITESMSAGGLLLQKRKGKEIVLKKSQISATNERGGEPSNAGNGLIFGFQLITMGLISFLVLRLSSGNINVRNSFNLNRINININPSASSPGLFSVFMMEAMKIAAFITAFTEAIRTILDDLENICEKIAKKMTWKPNKPDVAKKSATENDEEEEQQEEEKE